MDNFKDKTILYPTSPWEEALLLLVLEPLLLPGPVYNS